MGEKISKLTNTFSMVLTVAFFSLVCKSDINLVFGVHVLEKPARTNRNRCHDSHGLVFPVHEHLKPG